MFHAKTRRRIEEDLTRRHEGTENAKKEQRMVLIITNNFLIYGKCTRQGKFFREEIYSIAYRENYYNLHSSCSTITVSLVMGVPGGGLWRTTQPSPETWMWRSSRRRRGMSCRLDTPVKSGTVSFTAG